jgi:hypothetical protein
LDLVIVSLVMIMPVGFGYVIQAIGERHGWSVWDMLRVGFAATWLWYSVAFAVATHMGLTGFLVTATVLGGFMLALYPLIVSMRRDILEKYENDLARKRTRGRSNS